jgi:hypothetical protein
MPGQGDHQPITAHDPQPDSQQVRGVQDELVSGGRSLFHREIDRERAFTKRSSGPNSLNLLDIDLFHASISLD